MSTTSPTPPTKRKPKAAGRDTARQQEDPRAHLEPAGDHRGPGPRGTEPIGMFVTQRSRTISREFDRTLADAGGSLPMWLVLLTLKGGARSNQQHLAESLGVEGATLTHHLNRMERSGLVTRTRDTTDRRVHVVELTDSGHQSFLALVDRVQAFDRRLRAGFSDDELTTLRALLERLATNATADETSTTDATRSQRPPRSRRSSKE